MTEIVEQVRRDRIIVIARGIRGEQALPLAQALWQGGIRMMEITFDQADPGSWQDTAEGIKAIRRGMGDALAVGAGTVLTTEQLQVAAEAGASYIITPNVDEAVIRAAQKAGLRCFPGAMTPTEIVQAYKAGADAVKVFPAGSLGPGYIKAIHAPLSHIPLLAVGGIHEGNAGDYLRAGCLGLGVGGNLVDKTLVREENWEEIRRRAASLCAAVREFV